MIETLDFDAKTIIKNNNKLFIPSYTPAERSDRFVLSARMKGLVLLGYKQKYGANDCDIKRCLLRWYSNSKA